MNVSRSIRKQRCAHPLGYAMLVVLLLFQVGYASHVDEHAIGDVPGSCELCVLADQSDGAPVAEQTAALPLVEQAAPRSLDSRPAEQLHSSRYLPRAPPLV